jgi:hypothetical protein
LGSSHILQLCGSFDSLQAVLCRGWRFQDSGQTKHFRRLHDGG